MTTVVDAIGQRHARFANPSALRIACLVPSITETLFALGLGNKVVARTGFCIHPEPAIRDVPKVGGTKDVNVGKLIETEPTHVIVNIDENRKETVDHLRKVIPHVIVTHPMIPEDNATLFQLLGHIFSADDTALRLARALATALTRARTVGASRPLAPEWVVGFNSSECGREQVAVEVPVGSFARGFGKEEAGVAGCVVECDFGFGWRWRIDFAGQHRHCERTHQSNGKSGERSRRRESCCRLRHMRRATQWRSPLR